MLSLVQPLVTPWTAAHQALLSMGFSRQEYWSGVPLPPLTDKLISFGLASVVEPISPALFPVRHDLLGPWDLEQFVKFGFAYY